jgi:hypothetical protein
VLTTCLISVALALINIGSEQALESILSFTVSSWEAAAAIPLSLLLWNRMTGRIRPYGLDHGNAVVGDDTPLTWGPWAVPEPYGTVINAVGLCWIIITFFFSFWPSDVAPTPASMNYSVLMTGFWFVFGVGYYSIIGRKVRRSFLVVFQDTYISDTLRFSTTKVRLLKRNRQNAVCTKNTKYYLFNLKL